MDTYDWENDDESEDIDNNDNSGESDDEFDQFNKEYTFGYTQIGHVGYGDAELGTQMGGKMSKLEKMLQLQSVPKEKLFINKFKGELTNYVSTQKVDHYAEIIQTIPRYWLKNIKALCVTISLADAYDNTINETRLKDFSKANGIREVDILRYFRLLEQSLIKYNK
jgi:hypothetical protein